MKKLNNKRGISLIVLVITIIVMIILATAIILSIQNSRIIVKANEAKSKSDNFNLLQAANEAYGEYLLEKNLGKPDKTAEEYVRNELKDKFTQDKLNSLNILSDGTIQILPIIPTGFTVSIYPGEQKVSDGLVVYKTSAETLASKSQDYAQRNYDQFVWVPVNNMDEFKRTEWSNNKPTGLIPEIYIEPFESGYPTEVEEYIEMETSVSKYGGFYIARYESGDGSVSSRRTTATTGAHTVVIKKGAYVYNYVTWGNSMTDITSDAMYDTKNLGKGAIYLSQNMYNEERDKNYTTNLIYGVQWDSTLRWLSDKYDVTDSRSWGNYKDSKEDAATNSGATAIDYTTGRNEAWKAKNIYDLAGNFYEWTLETRRWPEVSKDYRVFRGGNYKSVPSGTGASLRGSGWSGAFCEIGFRPTLYLK